jgi:hypothetical protein
MQNEDKQRLKDSNAYRWMQSITIYLDKYYLDAVIGLVPGGIGDAVSAVFALVHVYFSLFRLRSIPLTLAILNNTLRDIFLGMIPFYVGDVIDFFHKANKKNMALIDGFINDNQDIIHEVNKKAIQSLLVLLSFVVAIFLMIRFIVWLAQTIGTLLFS